MNFQPRWSLDDMFLQTESSSPQPSARHSQLQEQRDELLARVEVLTEDRERLRRQVRLQSEREAREVHRAKLQRVQLELLQRVIQKREEDIQQLKAVNNKKWTHRPQVKSVHCTPVKSRPSPSRLRVPQAVRVALWPANR